MPGVVLIVKIPDICLLPYYLYSHEYRLTRNTVYCAIPSDQIVVGCPLGVPNHIINVYKITTGYLFLVCLTLLLRLCCNSITASYWVN